MPRSHDWNEVVKPVGDPLIAGSAAAADVLPLVDGVQKILTSIE